MSLLRGWEAEELNEILDLLVVLECWNKLLLVYIFLIGRRDYIPDNLLLCTGVIELHLWYHVNQVVSYWEQVLDVSHMYLVAFLLKANCFHNIFKTIVKVRQITFNFDLRSHMRSTKEHGHN